MRRCSELMVFNTEGLVLMQLRDSVDGIVFPGHWSCFGGGIEGDETPEAAVLREFEEETGITLSADQISPFDEFKSPEPYNDYIYSFIAHLDIKPSDITVLEGCGFAFLNKRQIEDFLVVPDSKPVILRAFDAL